MNEEIVGELKNEVSKLKWSYPTLLGTLNVINFISYSTLVMFKLIKNIIPHVTRPTRRLLPRFDFNIV